MEKPKANQEYFAAAWKIASAIFSFKTLCDEFKINASTIERYEKGEVLPLEEVQTVMLTRLAHLLEHGPKERSFLGQLYEITENRDFPAWGAFSKQKGTHILFLSEPENRRMVIGEALSRIRDADPLVYGLLVYDKAISSKSRLIFDKAGIIIPEKSTMDLEGIVHQLKRNYDCVVARAGGDEWDALLLDKSIQPSFDRIYQDLKY